MRIDLQWDIFRVLFLGNVRIGYHRVLRFGNSYFRDGVHQLTADARALFGNGRFRVKADGGPVKDLAEPRCHIQGNKRKFLPGFFVVEPGEIHESVLKFVNDIVMLLITFRKNNQPSSLPKLPDGFTKSGNHPHIAVNGYRLRVGEYNFCNRGDQVAEYLIEPPSTLLAVI